MIELESGQMVGKSFSVRTNNGEDDLIDAAQGMASTLGSDEYQYNLPQRRTSAIAPNSYYDEYAQRYVDADISIVDHAKLTRDEAAVFCTNMGQGWRLPTREEAAQIYNARSAIISNGGTPFAANDYWTSSYPNNYEGYVINFNTGNEDCYSKNIKNIFRCVRYHTE
jgi:hypothetical protein